jgi:hypothetical protein
MNIDEFDIYRLTAKGLHYDEEKDFSTDFVIKRRFDEPLWSAPWLQYTLLFAWHITAKPEQIARTHEIGKMTFDEIDKHKARGIELFGPVRSF